MTNKELISRVVNADQSLSITVKMRAGVSTLHVGNDEPMPITDEQAAILWDVLPMLPSIRATPWRPCEQCTDPMECGSWRSCERGKQ